MTTSNRFSSTSMRRIVIAGIAVSSMFVMALPSLASAATYAYVNKSGEVSTVTANDWQTALATATNIHINSGVMLLTSQLDNIVGDSVNGM
ncbi:MAG: hypothetical protein Q8L30_01825 [bacterium]|nr:hypothetical protein [bacterium]